MPLHAHDKRQRRINITNLALSVARDCSLHPLVVFVDAHSPDRPIGSGTLIRSGDTCAVLTCKHVLEQGWRSVNLRHVSSNGYVGTIVDVVEHPSLDLAVTVLHDSHLPHFALPVVRIAGPELFPVTDMQPIIVVGFPDYMVSDVTDNDGKLVSRTVRHTSYLTRLHGTSSDVLSIQWDEAEPDERDTGDYSKRLPSDLRFNLKKPSGLSGGGVWTFDAMYDGQGIPGEVPEMIGVPHQFTNRRQLALPSRRWRGWVIETMSAIAR